jgi:hypothetical protein
MRKLLNLFAATTSISDTNSYGVGLSGLAIGSGTSFTESWSLFPYGYRPGADTLMSAVATFTLFEGETSNLYTVTLDNSSLVNGNNFKGLFAFGNGTLGSVLGQLSETGILTFTVSNSLTAGESFEAAMFHLESATVTAEFSTAGIVPAVAAVPETRSTMALLGLGATAVAFLRRLS